MHKARSKSLPGKGKASAEANKVLIPFSFAIRVGANDKSIPQTIPEFP